MKLITREIKAAGAAEDYKYQYGLKIRNGEPCFSKKHEALLKLGPNPNPDDVDRVIGNKLWTEVGSCDECEEEKTVLVELGEESDYESATAYVCQECLEKALKLIKEK